VTNSTRWKRLCPPRAFHAGTALAFDFNEDGTETQEATKMHWMNGWMNGYGGWFMGGMWLFWILLLIVLVLVVRSVASGFRQREGTRGAPGDSAFESPEDVLKKRYARGEISRDEFELKLRDLRGHETPHATPSRP
jgi:putative membrane protein